MKTETPREVTVNTEQGLYVIPCDGGGYTCLGFAVAQRKARAVLDWLTAWFPPDQRESAGLPVLDATPGTIEHYRQYEAIMLAGGKHAAEVKGRRCNAELTPALIGLEGKRVEVTLPSGEKTRFYVGKSTGWMPCHLEIKRKDSSGGGCVYFPEGATVRVVGGSR